MNNHASQSNTTHETVRSVTYKITGMHCGGCVSKVEKSLAPFATRVKVTLIPPQAVLFEQKSGITEMSQALASIGDYQLSEIESTPIAPPHHNQQKNAFENASWLSTYQPLLLIIGYIFLTTIAIELAKNNANLSQFNLHDWMMNFMAGFFLVFSFFKLLNLQAFARSYAMYDVLAQRFPSYGLIYPFIELALGLAYVLRWQPTMTNAITFLVMGFSSLGVIRAVLNKQKIRCACLGGVFNLPMSTITIIEDLAMACMAAWMLI